MNVERAKTILTETLFSKSSNGSNDLVNLPGGRPLIADPLIYRLTFDSEDDDYNDDDDDDDDKNQLFTKNNNNLKSIDINDVNMTNVWSSNWKDNNQYDDHNDNGHDKMKINDPEFEKTLFKSRPTIKLNVSSLADEIIDSEMNSLKCLQIKPTTITTIKDDNHLDKINDETNDKNYNSKSTGQCPSNGNKQWKSLILPSLMRGTINTETSIITYNCPPSRAFFSCCIIS